MPDGVADAHGPRPATNRRRVKSANHVGRGAGGVFGDEHHRQAFLDGKGDGGFRQFQQFVQRPAFGVKTHGRRTQKGAGFNGDAGALRDVHDGLNVVQMSAGRAVGRDFQLLCDDFPRQTLDARRVSAARAWQTNIGGIYA